MAQLIAKDWEKIGVEITIAGPWTPISPPDRKEDMT
jgi:hypothetical protein